VEQIAIEAAINVLMEQKLDFNVSFYFKKEEIFYLVYML